MSIKKSDLTRADRINMENAGMSEEGIREFCELVYDHSHLNEIRQREFFDAQQDWGLVSFFVHDENTNTRRRRTGVLQASQVDGIGMVLFRDQGSAHAFYDEFWCDFTQTREISPSSYNIFLKGVGFVGDLNIDDPLSFYSFSEIVNPRFNFAELTEEQIEDLEECGIR